MVLEENYSSSPLSFQRISQRERVKSVWEVRMQSAEAREAEPGESINPALGLFEMRLASPEM